MGTITRNLKSFGGSLFTLAVLLIALMWILNIASKHGWGPLAPAAAKVQGLVTGDSYGSQPTAAPMPYAGPSVGGQF
jgi:hypothetical protein